MEVNVSVSYQDHAALVYKNLLQFVDIYLFKFISVIFFFLTKQYTLKTWAYSHPNFYSQILGMYKV